MLAAMSKTTVVPDAALMQEAVAQDLCLPVTNKMVIDIARLYRAMLLKRPKHNPTGPAPMVEAMQMRFTEMHIYIDDCQFVNAAIARKY